MFVTVRHIFYQTEKQIGDIAVEEKYIKPRLAYVTKFIAVALLFGVSAGIVGFVTGRDDDTFVPTVSPSAGKAPVIVIDAGHGGEDGGASSDSGISEKDLNLQISKLCAVILKAGGYDVRLTRTDDRLVYDMYDDLEDYHGKKKVYDLRNRIRFAEEAEADVFVSIHMNKFFQSQYSGMQVYYSQNNPASADFAAAVQGSVREHLQSDNDRETKMATSSIYILKNIKIPAILVEVGFLSNPTDLKNLTDDAYRVKMASCISSALANSFGE